jgi:PAS domain S-box-containing protein
MRRDDGSVEKILYLGLDTTEQKKQSLDYEGQIEALNRATHKIELLPSGDVLDANQNFLNLMEYSEGEVKNKTIFDFIQKADLNELKNIWEKVKNNETYQGQMKHLSRDGKEIWMQMTLTAVNDIYGEVSKVVYIGHDITKQKQMEIEANKQAELLKEKEEKLEKSQQDLSKKLEKAREDVKKQFREIEQEKIRNERTLEGASDAIITIDQEGTVRFFNKAAEELWGVEKDMIVGRNVQKLFPKKLDEYEDFIQRFVDPDKDKIVGERKEVTITNADGEDLPVIFLLSMAKVDKETTYTAFIQNISVDLF